MFNCVDYILTHLMISLQEFGHHVRLATHANFRAFVRSAGVDFYPLGGDPRVLAGCKMSPCREFLFTFSVLKHLVSCGRNF